MDFTDNPFRWKRLSQATKKHERSQKQDVKPKIGHKIVVYVDF